jgi:hypothetical protein
MATIEEQKEAAIEHILNGQGAYTHESHRRKRAAKAMMVLSLDTLAFLELCVDGFMRPINGAEK